MDLNRLSDELEKTLTDNLKLYDEMGKALEEEFTALKAYSLPRLDAAIKWKMLVSSKLKLIEETRNAKVSKVAGKLGMSRAELSLKMLAEKMGGDIETRLLSLRSRLNEAVKNVSEKNDFNRGFIEKLMSVNSASAVHLRELLIPEATYVKGGFTPVTAFKPGQVVSRTY
jgi:hypothetical protein